MTQPYRSGADAAQGGPGGSGTRVTVASYANYADAERAVDYLSDRGFPVDRVAIVGRGLSTVEHVTGRLTIWRAAGRMALSGAVTGALFGWLFGLLRWINPLISSLLLVLYGLVFGAVVGAILGLVGHAATGGRRDFSSVTGMRADSYELVVDAEVAAEASRQLSSASAIPSPSPHAEPLTPEAGGTYPGGTYPGGTYPGGTYPGGTYPGTNPGGTNPGG